MISHPCAQNERTGKVLVKRIQFEQRGNFAKLTDIYKMEIVFAKPDGQVKPDFFEGEAIDLACSFRLCLSSLAQRLNVTALPYNQYKT